MTVISGQETSGWLVGWTGLTHRLFLKRYWSSVGEL